MDKERRDFLHTGLTPSFGTLNKGAMKTMDKKLKVNSPFKVFSLYHNLPRTDCHCCR